MPSCENVLPERRALQNLDGLAGIGVGDQLVPGGVPGLGHGGFSCLPDGCRAAACDRSESLSREVET